VNVLGPNDISCGVDDVDENLSPAAPLTPDVPDVPLLPATPDEPVPPDVPDVPLVPEVPEVPEVPAAIEAWRKSKLLSISAAVSGDPFVRRLVNAILYYSLCI
jgi:hypothetical protein